MPSLQIRDLPERIYRKLLRQAEKEHRSLSQEAVVVLDRCIAGGHDPRERRREVLRRILQRPDMTGDRKLPDPAKMIREDRDR